MAEHAVWAVVEGLSWLPGGTGKWEEGGAAREEGLALRDALQNAVVLIAREIVLFHFKQQVSEVLPELYYSVACQGWQSLQVFCFSPRAAASLALR